MEPTSEWEGNDLVGCFLRNEVSGHKPRRLTGKVECQKEGTVMTVQSTDLLPSVFKKLSTEGFLSAPVCIGSDLVGEVTLLDLVKHVNSLFFGSSESDWIDWFEKKLYFQTTPVSMLTTEPSEYLRHPYKTMSEHFTSFAALELMAREKNHQILLLDSSPGKKLCGILTQSMLISFLRQNKEKWGPDFTNLKVIDFQFDEANKKPLQTVEESETAINAFLRMEEEDVHGLPIVDKNGVLTGCISVRDLRGVGTDGSQFYRLYRTVRAYKDMVRSEHESLAPPTHYSKEQVPFGGVYVTPQDTMETVIKKMNDGNLHRVFICSVESARLGRPIPMGVISQSDVLLNTLEYIVRRCKRGQVQPSKSAVAERQVARKVSSGKLTRESGESKQSSPGKRSIPIH